APAMRLVQPAPASAPLPALSVSATEILRDAQAADRETRQAALQRARELDERALVPHLQELARQTFDETDKRDLLETIDFLNAPDPAENLANVQAARAASGQPTSPRSPTNRW